MWGNHQGAFSVNNLNYWNELNWIDIRTKIDNNLQNHFDAKLTNHDKPRPTSNGQKCRFEYRSDAIRIEDIHCASTVFTCVDACQFSKQCVSSMPVRHSAGLCLPIDDCIHYPVYCMGICRFVATGHEPPSRRRYHSEATGWNKLNGTTPSANQPHCMLAFNTFTRSAEWHVLTSRLTENHTIHLLRNHMDGLDST